MGKTSRNSEAVAAGFCTYLFTTPQHSIVGGGESRMDGGGFGENKKEPEREAFGLGLVVGALARPPPKRSTAHSISGAGKAGSEWSHHRS